MKQTFATPISRINFLLTRTLGAPQEVSDRLCQKLESASEDVQKVFLREIGEKALEIKRNKEEDLQKVRLIKAKIKNEVEKTDKNQAEVDLSQALKNI